LSSYFLFPSRKSRLFWLLALGVPNDVWRSAKVEDRSLSLARFAGTGVSFLCPIKKNRQFIKKCMTFPSPLTNQNRNKPMARLQGHHTLHTHTHTQFDGKWESVHKETASWEKTTLNFKIKLFLVQEQNRRGNHGRAYSFFFTFQWKHTNGDREFSCGNTQTFFRQNERTQDYRE
jgi:hypothetical protein